ncbi:hypothetical protein [Bathymodiolus platifrons methanotrophic gill symbiont]|uniref:hypothetical protein n=1 Tax=Bathymodiolus platifrons methanotrophic gill symbiont TaxID=113268 RepID=UPI001C8DFF08|nr:hypothetical protein [Bathymodiolus platifrons methanotrophic gill symbiont]
MAATNGSTAIRDKILASLARYRALRIGKFPCAFWRLSARPGLTAIVSWFLASFYEKAVKLSPYFGIKMVWNRSGQCCQSRTLLRQPIRHFLYTVEVADLNRLVCGI